VTADDLLADRALEAAAEDEFKHDALAGRVAELVTTAQPPLNIALFGAWGSGKSSIAGFLKERFNAGEYATSVAFVYYDAWKYGGESLRRNFISRAAAEFKLPRRDARFERYYRGLYRSSRRVRLERGAVRRIVPIALLALGTLFLAVTMLTAITAGVVSVLTDEDFLGQAGRVLPRSLGGAGLAAAAAAVGTGLLALAKFDVEESAPSADEEFNDTFGQLVDDVRGGTAQGRPAIWGWNQRLPASVAEPPPDRLVFFIDELDRCAEEDVVKTLVAVRTFLDQAHCVFIVAADRTVLETALDKAVDQETPTTEDAPYYSTAGAFLDKVFQHQLTVPPLRTRRLTRFARDQVAKKETGLWRELRDGSHLDDVIYALIPAHVRSPRRIKVLLNNFAVNARVAQSRGVAWPAAPRRLQS
jgi:hypothetical protein